jgi:hypothetical protein
MLIDFVLVGRIDDVVLALFKISHQKGIRDRSVGVRQD